MEKIKEYKWFIILLLVVIPVAILSWYAYELKLDEEKILSCAPYAQRNLGDNDCGSAWYKCIEKSDLFIKIKC